MKPQEQDLIRRLLKDEHTATLGVTIEKRPYLSLVPFVWLPEMTAVIIHTSGLARHSAGLYSGAPFSLLVHASFWTHDPLQTPRLTLQGEASLILPDTQLYHSGKAHYLARFPKATITFSLRDFSLFALHISEMRAVLGFGKAYSLSADALRLLFEA
ncbi:MAG: hypothetical protein Fur0018_25990 [Anaerolineales bacterium]